MSARGCSTRRDNRCPHNKKDAPMSWMTPLVCLLLASGTAPAISEDDPVQPMPLFEVMQIKSGVEVVVKRDGRPASVRLIGVETPRRCTDARVDILSQRKFLAGLLPVGEKVRLETESGAAADEEGHPLAQVWRASDDLWLNRELVEQGYATASEQYVSQAQPFLEAAEARARAAGLGMWASDYRDRAVKPTSFQPPRPRRRYAHSGRSWTETLNVPVPTPLMLPAPYARPVPVVPTSAGRAACDATFGYGFGGLATCGGRGLGRPVSLAVVEAQMRSFVAAASQRQAYANNLIVHLMAAYPAPPAVVSGTPSPASWTPAYAHGFGMSGPSGIAGAGGTGIGAAGHFAGFAHGGGHH
jgi:endonuclease YncB( thermonuclease family)